MFENSFVQACLCGVSAAVLGFLFLFVFPTRITRDSTGNSGEVEVDERTHYNQTVESIAATALTDHPGNSRYVDYDGFLRDYPSGEVIGYVGNSATGK